MESKNWHTIKQVCEKRPIFTQSALRNHIHRANQNGLAEHITRIGRRVFIDLNGLDKWIEEGR